MLNGNILVLEMYLLLTVDHKKIFYYYAYFRICRKYLRDITLQMFINFLKGEMRDFEHTSISITFKYSVFVQISLKTMFLRKMQPGLTIFVFVFFFIIVGMPVFICF